MTGSVICEKSVNKLHKIYALIILVCSITLFCVGIYIFWGAFPRLLLSLKHCFFNKAPVIFDLLFILYGFGTFLSGIIGIVASISLLKKQRGAERFWLLLIFLHFIYFLLLELSAENVNYLSIIINIVVFVTIVVSSWFILCRNHLFSLKTNSKHYILEITLVMFVILQISGIYVFNPVEKNFLIQISNKNQYGPHPEKYWECHNYYEKKMIAEYEQCGNFLVSNGYENDRSTLSSLASVAYALGKQNRAIELIELAISVGYISNEVQPKGKMIYCDEAQLHFAKFAIFTEIGNETEAKESYSNALKLYAKCIGKQYTEQQFECFKTNASSALNRFNNAVSP